MCSEIWTEAAGRMCFSEIQRTIQTSWWCTDCRGWTQVDMAGRHMNRLCFIQAAEVNLASAWCYQRRQAEDWLSLEVMAQTELNNWHSFTFLHILLFNLWVLFFGSSPFSRISISLALFPPALLRSPIRFSGEGLCPSSLLVLLLRSHPSCQAWATSRRHHHHMCNCWHSPGNSHFG